MQEKILLIVFLAQKSRHIVSACGRKGKHKFFGERPCVDGCSKKGRVAHPVHHEHYTSHKKGRHCESRSQFQFVECGHAEIHKPYPPTFSKVKQEKAGLKLNVAMHLSRFVQGMVNIPDGIPFSDGGPIAGFWHVQSASHACIKGHQNVVQPQLFTSPGR